MHHERALSEEMREAFAEVFDAEKRTDAPTNRALGPTGRFPEGRLTENDEGEIRLAVGTFKGTVTMNFGVPIASLGLTPKQARGVALALRQHANRIERKL